MRRREFIAGLGGSTVAWPLSAHAQQPAMPVVGLLGSSTARGWAPYLTHFFQGLREVGFSEDRNVVIEYRWAEGQYDRLPAMAADLVQRRVSVIAALTTPCAIVAKAASAVIPIVFTTIGNPVQIGLVASLNHPGGNVTGATYLNVEIEPKMLELLHEMVPMATTMAVLINPTNPNSETALRNFQAAARTLRLQLNVLNASTEQEIDTAFAALVQFGAGGLVIGTDVLFNTRYQQFVALARRHAVPSIYQERSAVTMGGLMSYSGSATEVYRQAGIYAGRILKGANPADLPVQQSTKVELIINLKTAKELALTVPSTLLGRADEVIE